MKQLETPDRQIKHGEAKHLVVNGRAGAAAAESFAVCARDCGDEPNNLGCTAQQENYLADLTANYRFVCFFEEETIASIKKYGGGEKKQRCSFV